MFKESPVVLLNLRFSVSNEKFPFSAKVSTLDFTKEKQFSILSLISLDSLLFFVDNEFHSSEVNSFPVE